MPGSAETHLWLLEAVDQYEQPLTRYARRLLGDLDLAADAVQHAFVALCGESRSRVGDRVAPWLYRVCRNRAVDHLRHAGREQSLTAHDAASEHATVAQAGDASIDPAIAVEHADLATRLRELMPDLPAPSERRSTSGVKVSRTARSPPSPTDRRGMFACWPTAASPPSASIRASAA